MDFDSYLLKLTASLRAVSKYLHRFLFIYLPVCARRYPLKKGKVMCEQNFSVSFVTSMGRWGCHKNTYKDDEHKVCLRRCWV